MAGPKHIYRRVSLSMWSDEKFRRLSPLPPSGQSLWIWLLTGARSSRIPGIVIGHPTILALELGWPKRKFSAAFSEILNANLAEFENDAGLIWLPRGVNHNPPASPNVIRSWGREWPLVPECALREKAHAELLAFSRKMGPSFAKAFDEAFGEPSGKASSNQDQDQDQEQEQEGEPRKASPRSPGSGGPPWALSDPRSGPRNGRGSNARLSIEEILEAGKRMNHEQGIADPEEEP